MNIQLKNIKIADIIKNYQDSGENGVVGYFGKLNIRPAYQREFIYKEKQRNEVINTVRKNFPLNTMYWVKTDEDEYELMDGQQRTISICQFVAGDFGVAWDDGQIRFFGNLTEDQIAQFMNYELSIYICEGTDSEKLDWFKIINIAGEKLTSQELRNAIYTGQWLSDAKRWFSKSGSPAEHIGEKLVTGSAIRQEILEKTLAWISERDYSKTDIEKYMAEHQHDENASDLWKYFQEVIDWSNKIFPNQDSARVRLMKGLEWGRFYNNFKDKTFNIENLEKQIVLLIEDDEVDNKHGIYEYLLSGDTRTLSLRAFDEKIKQKKYAEQSGICPKCKKQFAIDEMEADHIIPWHKGGKTVLENCQMLCMLDNRTKSGQ